MNEHDAHRWLEQAAERPQHPRIPREQPPVGWLVPCALGAALAAILILAWALGPQVWEMVR